MKSCEGRTSGQDMIVLLISLGRHGMLAAVRKDATIEGREEGYVATLGVSCYIHRECLGVVGFAHPSVPIAPETRVNIWKLKERRHRMRERQDVGLSIVIRSGCRSISP